MHCSGVLGHVKNWHLNNSLPKVQKKKKKTNNKKPTKIKNKINKEENRKEKNYLQRELKLAASLWTRWLRQPLASRI